MNHRRLFSVISLAIVICLLLGACAQATTQAPVATQAPAAATQAPAAAGGKTYVLVPKNLGNPYFDTANKGAQEAAERAGRDR